MPGVSLIHQLATLGFHWLHESQCDLKISCRLNEVQCKNEMCAVIRNFEQTYHGRKGMDAPARGKKQPEYTVGYEALAVYRARHRTAAG